ncbi:nitrate reductase molybdenum cofactor assembly chaperone [Arsenicicoccus dermatophilus]|uniref:nitrate reductase molybdenum cofactor assembly chaperone n=1 Tax=Arsenicicoccus dermatophilus TaxID=1076331 RepID=UPI0039173CD7
MRLALRRRKQAQLPVPEDAMRATWQCASLLLGYPDEQLVAHLPLLRATLAQLPAVVAEPLGRVAAAVSAASDAGRLDELQTRYVDTFDHTRRCAPYLTYFAHGDTRKRGMALVQFTQAYRRAGVEIGDEELPDHLAVVLELGGTVDLEVALGLVLDHRAGLEVLRLALLDRESPWADVLVAVCATLPPLDGDESTAVARLVAAGPPAEEVGLAPYEIDPRLNPHPALDPSVEDLAASLHGGRS